MKKNVDLRFVLMIQVILFSFIAISFGQTNVHSLSGSNFSQTNSTQSQSRTIANSPVSSDSVSGAFRAASCAKPTGITSTVLGSTSATISWNANTGIMYYNFRYRIKGTTTWTNDSTITNSKTIIGLTPTTIYEYQVQTRCTSGLLSTFSAKLNFTTAVAVSCGTTSGLTASSVTTSGVTLSWTAVTGAVSYSIQYRPNSSTTWSSATSTTNSKSITGLNSGTTYQYQVSTVCSSGTSAYSTTATFTTNAASVNCGIPDVAYFGTINKTSSSATVYWTSIAGAVSYKVQYRVNNSGSAWTQLTTTIDTANLSGLAASTQYEFQVQSVCSGGTSAFSSSGIFTTTAFSCSIPSSASFISTGITTTSATIGWTAVSSATGYNIQYRVNGSGSTWNATSATTNSKLISGLSAGTTYEFQVQTICSGGNSSFSSSGIFTTSVAVSCGLPDVNYFTSTNKTAVSATVGWNAVSGATGYNVQYRVRNTGTWSTVSTSTVSANLTSLSASTNYEFQVQTICSGGVGAFSASGIFSTIAATTTCGVPTGMSASGITTSGATLGWTSVTGATSYTVQYRKSGTTSWTTVTTTSASKSVSGLLAATAYEFQVQTICSSGSSAFTASTGFTTLSSGSAALPVPDHIVVVMFENHAYQQIIGNSAAPHINAFAAEPNTTLFTESYGITHPSQPNYLHIFSGNNQGVTSNVKPTSKFTSMNLAAALLQAGLTFTSYSDGMPSAGYDGDVSGTYARKHNAVSNWVGTGTNQVPAALNQPFSAFPTDYSTLPTVSFVNPDMNNSMHDGSGNTAITNGDNWFYSKIYPYAQWARTHNSLLIFTFDEDDLVSANRIATIFSGQMVTQGQNATGINHYNVLRTIEDMYGLVHSGNAANASPIHGCWTNGYRVGTNSIDDLKSEINLSLYPNPVVDVLNAGYTLTEKSNVTLRLLSVVGKVVMEQLNPDQEAGKYDVSIPVSSMNVSKGIYFLEMTVNEKRIVKRFVVE